MYGFKRKKNKFIRRSGPIEYEGQSFKTLKALANNYGVDYKKFHSRVRCGWSIDEALNKVKKERIAYNGIPVEYEGIIYASSTVLAKKLGINPGTLYDRLKRSQSLEKACSAAILNTKPIEVGGTKFSSTSKACNHYGVSHSSIISKLERGFSIEEAFG